MTEPILVVGDRFTAFHRHRGVSAAAEVLDALRAGLLPASTSFVAGQGLAADQLAELAALATGPVTKPADYPHAPGYALVGPLTAVAADEWRCDLVLDDRVDVLDDHLNSEHMPAVTLIEAARQAWILTTEQHLLTEKQRAEWTVSEIRYVNTSFHRYLFPIPAVVTCRVVSRIPTRVGMSFEFDVAIHQGQTLCARVKSGIGVTARMLAAKQELLVARQAVRDELTRNHGIEVI